MNRRELLLGLAAGGTFIAGELWFPGKKLISIPKRESYTWTELFGPRQPYPAKVVMLEVFTALPNGAYLRTLSSEDRIIQSEVQAFCPYSNLLPGAKYISNEYWFDRNSVSWLDFNNLS